VDVAQLVEPRVVIPVVVGSSPIVHPRFYWPGPLAQLVEQETLNLLVVGSIPTRPTTSPGPSQAISGEGARRVSAQPSAFCTVDFFYI
jgi:hypothetical protein